MKFSQKKLDELLEQSESGTKILTEQEINALCFSDKVDAVAALCSVAESHRQLLKLSSKQIPKALKPTKYPCIAKCPVCKTELCTDDPDLHYCPTCGQALNCEL